LQGPAFARDRAQLRSRVEQADQAGEIGLKVQLEDMILDESTHRDDIRRRLVGWKKEER
jgi:hypothetical protein